MVEALHFLGFHSGSCFIKPAFPDGCKARFSCKGQQLRSFSGEKNVSRFARHPAAANSSSPLESSNQMQGPPVIELEFVGPESGSDGAPRLDTASAVSGEKLLRNIMLDNKIELYDLYGKVMNCGGGGSCGTCLVQILEGRNLLNERTDTEHRYLRKKPENWRLACQTIVGNKANSGKVVVQKLPQKKRK
eukprot:c26037_g1_i2 orf=111-680(+)